MFHKEGIPIDTTLIPFAFREIDGSFVDVSEVERGRKCGCICPSCKTPLIARQGNIKQWHFAHASRAVYEKTNKECEFSFFVSVRLMARQVVGESLKVRLPKYEDTVSFDADSWIGSPPKKFIVTDEKTVIIDGIEIEKSIYGVEVDIYGNVHGYPLILYFTHPGRNLPPDLMSPEDDQCGIVEVSLVNTYPLFVSNNKRGQSYIEKLRYFLAEDINSKRWIYHPRYKKVHAEALRLLEQDGNNIPQCRGNGDYCGTQGSGLFSSESIATVRKGEIPKRQVVYQCVMCDSIWTGVEPGCNPCPKCNTHLYAKPVKRSTNET